MLLTSQMESQMLFGLIFSALMFSPVLFALASSAAGHGR